MIFLNIYQGREGGGRGKIIFTIYKINTTIPLDFNMGNGYILM